VNLNLRYECEAAYQMNATRLAPNLKEWVGPYHMQGACDEFQLVKTKTKHSCALSVFGGVKTPPSHSCLVSLRGAPGARSERNRDCTRALFAVRWQLQSVAHDRAHDAAV